MRNTLNTRRRNTKRNIMSEFIVYILLLRANKGLCA